MKTIYKRIISLFLALSIAFSFTIVSFASNVDTGWNLRNYFNDLTYYALESLYPGTEQIYEGFLEWYWADNDTASSNYEEVHGGGGGSFGSAIPDTVTSTGTTNSYVYNNSSTSSTTNNTTNYHQIVNTTNNTYYNNLTNTYNTYNNITYNNEYNIYNITENNYNTYVTNNYTYVTYVIENTETGESAYYEMYYQLPDGRNSYDLTIDEIWGEYFIYNVDSCEQVAEDDGTTLGLWHLDGNLNDSSFYNNSGSTAGLVRPSQILCKPPKRCIIKAL